MTITRHETPDELLDRAGSWLMRAEAENNLILGLCREYGRFRVPCEQGWLLTLDIDGTVNGVAIMTPPYNLIVTQLTPAAIDELVDFLRAEKAPVPGVVGPSEVAAGFAEAWSLRTGCRTSLHMDQRLFKCEQVSPIAPAPGNLRHTEERDKELLLIWVRDFEIAARVHHAKESLEPKVDALLKSGRGRIWEDSHPVSCASYSRETENGVAVNFVYTPSEARGHGYASSCVAALTESLLASGKRFCCLYTDKANPTSNKIYQRIGYRPIADSQMWTFARDE